MEEQVEEKEIKVFKEIVEWCFCIFLALIIALATRYYIFTSTVVKQFSMYPTLKENQRIVLSRTKRITKSEYKRGDIQTSLYYSLYYNIWRTKRNKKRGRSRFIKQNCNLQLQTKRNMGKTFIQYSRTN